MPVTEFAIIQLKGGDCDALEFLEVLVEAQDAQDAWVRTHQPHNLAAGANLSSMYTEDAEQPSLLITAPWDSPEAHAEWIRSDQNQAVNARLDPFVAPGGCSVLLFHMEPAGKGAQMRKAFVHRDDGDRFDVCRLTVRPDQKADLQRRYQGLEDEARRAGLEQSIWAGWRVETGDDEELVVFWTKDIPGDKIKAVLSISDNRDHRQFMHIV